MLWMASQQDVDAILAGRGGGGAKPADPDMISVSSRDILGV